MSAALGFVLNAAGLFVPLGIELKGALEKPKQGTSVQIIVGSGDGTTGGNVPHIALWDDDGNRIGQYHPSKKDKISEGEPRTITVEHTQTRPKYQQADPYYVTLSNLENDAICIAAVTIANEKISGTFYGDTGFSCGQSWFLSRNKIGQSFQTPRCVWLDADHTNKINARALSFHLNDLAPSTDKLSQYQENKDSLCKSTPRFSFWGNLLPDGIVPFFKPKLQYKEDSSGGGEGADEDPKKVIDKNNQYDKSVYMHQGEHKQKTGRARDTGSANHNPEHLVITDYEDHDVREVCEHPNSYGWDVVSTRQGLFCDIDQKQLYVLCSDAVKDNCFDLENKVIVPKGGMGSRDELSAHVLAKTYKTLDHWKN
ncbi:hypothetical protein F4818DRAFT_442635 [Hypoxylon cercidicola]|nr:hypothetical protein F4818DRAFT_442635 [Hypoxylon cercidicola]